MEKELKKYLEDWNRISLALLQLYKYIILIQSLDLLNLIFSYLIKILCILKGLIFAFAPRLKSAQIGPEYRHEWADKLGDRFGPPNTKAPRFTLVILNKIIIFQPSPLVIRPSVNMPKMSSGSRSEITWLQACDIKLQFPRLLVNKFKEMPNALL